MIRKAGRGGIGFEYLARETGEDRESSSFSGELDDYHQVRGNQIICRSTAAGTFKNPRAHRHPDSRPLYSEGRPVLSTTKGKGSDLQDRLTG